MSDLLLSDKYKAFVSHVLRGDSALDVLEGTTAAGKTTVGMFAFISRIYHNTSVKPSIIAGLDTGTVEKTSSQQTWESWESSVPTIRMMQLLNTSETVRAR